MGTAINALVAQDGVSREATAPMLHPISSHPCRPLCLDPTGGSNTSADRRDTDRSRRRPPRVKQAPTVDRFTTFSAALVPSGQLLVKTGGFLGLPQAGRELIADADIGAVGQESRVSLLPNPISTIAVTRLTIASDRGVFSQRRA